MRRNAVKVTPILFVVVPALYSISMSGCETHARETPHHEQHTIVATSPVAKDVVSTQRYVCQIHSRRHIEICALEGGYLEEIRVKEGQAVKQGDLMFKIYPAVYEAKLAAAVAEAQLVQIEFNNTQNLFEQQVVSKQELALAKAKLAKAQAEVKLARTELSFTEVRAPFDGIVDRQYEQLGSLIEEGDMLTTLSGNDVMWVYFNVPEARYLEYRAGLDQVDDDGSADDVDDDDDDDDDDIDDDIDDDDDIEDDVEEVLQIELVLANGEVFPQIGEISAIEAEFNNETGNIAFRADFPNPDGLLRHGQTGTVLIHRVIDDAIVIPQRATFEILAKQFVWIVDEDGVVHQREIVIQDEMEDIFVIESGLDVNDKIVLGGVRQVHDGEKLEYEFREPKEVLANLKYHAE